METTNEKTSTENPKVSDDKNNFIDEYWDKSWTYIKTVIDVVREPILILDANLKVLSANEPFYEIFKVKKEDTEDKLVYELGNGQWKIPSLQKLLEHILPKHTFFKGFEVTHHFPVIGRKIMILNARQIHVENEEKKRSIILLAMEDVTEMMDVAQMLARHSRQFELKTAEREEKMKILIRELEKEIQDVKNNS